MAKQSLKRKELTGHYRTLCIEALESFKSKTDISTFTTPANVDQPTHSLFDPLTSPIDEVNDFISRHISHLKHSPWEGDSSTNLLQMSTLSRRSIAGYLYQLDSTQVAPSSTEENQYKPVTEDAPHTHVPASSLRPKSLTPKSTLPSSQPSTSVTPKKTVSNIAADPVTHNTKPASESSKSNSDILNTSVPTFEEYQEKVKEEIAQIPSDTEFYMDLLTIKSLCIKAKTIEDLDRVLRKTNRLQNRIIQSKLDKQNEIVLNNITEKNATVSSSPKADDTSIDDSSQSATGFKVPPAPLPSSKVTDMADALGLDISNLMNDLRTLPKKRDDSFNNRNYRSKSHKPSQNGFFSKKY